MKFIANPVEVDAWPITEVGPLQCNGSRRIRVGGDDPLSIEPGLAGLMADAGMLARLTNLAPIPGDYVVRQADGYIYLNPKHVFERKYRPDAPGFTIAISDGNNSRSIVSLAVADFKRGYATMSRETFYEAWIRPALEQLLGPSPAAEPNALELGAMVRAAGLAGE